jgi:putative spermidine/putrescine transport system permease protein
MRFVRPIAVAFTAALALVPFALLGIWSFARSWFWPALLPESWSPRAWAYVLAPESGVGSALVTSIGIALLVTALSIVSAMPAARTLAYHEFPGKRLFLFVLLLPVLASPLASAMGVHGLFLRFGLTETVLGVALVHLIPAVPYATLMLTGSFSTLDRDLEAQARTLGATPLAVWRYVRLPAIAPGLAVASAFAFLISWSQYLMTLLIGGGRVLTLPLTLVAFQRGGDESITAALCLIFIAPTLLVFSAVAQFVRYEA